MIIWQFMRCRGLIVFTFLLLPLIAFAQQSRKEEIAEKKAEKANNLSKYVKSRAEKIVESLTGPRDGFYPLVGSAFSGGGFAVGPGYFKSFGDNGITDTRLLWSIENYKNIQTNLLLPSWMDRRLIASFQAKYIDAGHVSFFGLGNNTVEDDRTNFGYQPASAGIAATFAPAGGFSLGAGLEYLHVNTQRGDADDTPSIEQEFNPVTAPGLGSDPTYTVKSLFAAYDWRETPGYTTSGGYYRFDWYDYNEHGDTGGFSFRRYDVELDQYFPILRANQLIAVRALFSFTDVEDGQQVPFFMMPKLGGGSDLRGFKSHRFRDRHRMLLTAEYRWTPSKFLDMAIFYEVGKVASRSRDLDLDDLHSSTGIGARFHAPNATVLRIELAHSREVTRLIFDTGILF